MLQASELDVDLTLSGTIPFIYEPFSKEAKETVTIPAETVSVPLPLGLSITVTEDGAKIEADLKEGPLNLVSDSFSVGGTENVDVTVDGFRLKGTLTLRAKA